MSVDVFDYLIEDIELPSEMASVLIGNTDEDTIKNCIAVNKLINNDRAAQKRAREQGQGKTDPKKKSGSSSGKSRLDALIEKYSK